MKCSYLIATPRNTEIFVEMKLFVVALVVVVAVCQASPAEFELAEWASFKIRHEKNYADHKEESKRLSIYKENVRKIHEHNRRYDLGQVSFRLAVNKFADMTQKEFTAAHNGYNRSAMMPGLPQPRGSLFSAPKGLHLPDTVDWVSQGAVTPVKNQGQCGSCWSFGSTGALEGQVFLKTGSLVSLSEQNLIDCSGSYGNQGCNGGWMDYAYEYIRDNGGIDTEDSYPYEATEGYCRYNPSDSAATVSGYVDIPEGDEDQLATASATIGPISVAIDASHQSFQFYNDGVYYEPECSSYALDHAVLVVGYGTEDGQDYWLIKNSWGSSWGMQGYFKMARNQNNHCGVATKASYPTV